jgi:predicted Zn-dependent protease
VIKLNPDNSTHLSDLATAIFYHTYDEKRATELLEKAISLDPQNVVHYITLALLKLSYDIKLTLIKSKNRERKKEREREREREREKNKQVDVY